VKLRVRSAHLEESSMEKNTYSPESTIPSSSAASSISRMVVELAHITTTEIKKEKEDMVSYRETSLKTFRNIIALGAPSGCLPNRLLCRKCSAGPWDLLRKRRCKQSHVAFVACVDRISFAGSRRSTRTLRLLRFARYNLLDIIRPRLHEFRESRCARAG